MVHAEMVASLQTPGDICTAPNSRETQGPQFAVLDAALHNTRQTKAQLAAPALCPNFACLGNDIAFCSGACSLSQFCLPRQ